MITAARSVLFIVDGSVAVTGALVSAARQAVLLADEVDTIIALPRGHKVPAARLSPFAAVLELPIVPLRKSLKSLVSYVPALILSTIQLRRKMQQQRCERVQINDFYLLQGAMLRLLGFPGRVVTFVRIDPRRFGMVGRLWLFAARLCSTEMVAVSHFIQRQLSPGDKSRLLYEQVEIQPACGQHVEKGSVLLFVGNFIEGKGQEKAIAAFNQIAVDFPDAKLRLVGGDMQLPKNRLFRDRLVALAHAGPASDRIEFRGSTDDVASEFEQAFVALNFSISESFSMTCLEASAAGLPVIATRCGGPEEIIEDGKTGFLVPVDDVNAMAERMAWLLGHPDEAAAMGRAGQELLASKFSPKKARAAFTELFGLPLRFS